MRILTKLCWPRIPTTQQRRLKINGIMGITLPKRIEKRTNLFEKRIGKLKEKQAVQKPHFID
jgi:hypothetical protein